ncbi:zinc-binding dehydrogenase [Streptomonospora sp. S1-112]|uniref:Zinc-binding dehydrogenase n=1 Tax=Streptomonospora mangrovi TaxID=2883123 RepID=A0A9X3NPT4_9ACTN|nr:zinc-binding dehydrogenase [Streptomonospora mangrovi]
MRTGAPGWERDLAALLPAGGADVVFDCVGGPQGAALLRALAPHGRLVQYGLLSGRPIPPGGDGAADRRIVPFHLRRLVHDAPRAELFALFDRAFAHLRAGRLATRVGAEHPLADIRSALRRPPQGGGKPLILL